MDLARLIIKEPEVRDARHYAHRLRLLCGLYLSLFFLCVAGCIVLLWHGRLYVTLTQRSNVETLTLAFFLVFFAYLAMLSRRGAIGALRISYHALRGLRLDRVTHERRKAAALPPLQKGLPSAVAVNLLVARQDRPREAFEIPIADQAGSMGRLRIDGARLEHIEARPNESNNLFAYFVEQLRQVVEKRTGAPVNFDIVEWRSLDEEATESYLSQASFALRLARHLDAEELWPTLTLTAADCLEMERRLAAICPALRDEAMLPDWEYAGEHKLPIIPEPLGLLSLSRTARRVDPLASMCTAVVIVLIAFALLVFITIHPPWVPGP
jgi:hypothetical protein